MKHFLIYIALVFSALSFFYFNRQDKVKLNEDRTIRVYASSSFIAKWGPAPQLKELFEKQGTYKVEFIESPDISMTMQKISFENQNSLADVVLGLDQFDIPRSAQKIKWKALSGNPDTGSFTEAIKDSEAIRGQNFFIAYDWAPMTFITRKEMPVSIEKLDDLLKPALQGKIALQDPRLSSPGLQFLAWVFESKSEDEAKIFLKNMMKQAHSFSSSWSSAYGLFKNKQAEAVFSYVTSPIYHLVEEKDSSYISLELKEALPVQVEFAGVPATCKNCDGAEKFVSFLTSVESQKVIMKKNFMLPVIDHIKESTEFDTLKIYKTNPVRFYDQEQIEKWISTWTEIRKNEGL